MREKLDEAEKELARLKSETDATEKQLREELQEARVTALSARSSAASLKVGLLPLPHHTIMDRGLIGLQVSSPVLRL